MPPAGGETGGRNAEILIQLGTWAKEDGTGKVFDSSTGFRLPSGAVRSPDASWLSKARWEELGEEQRKKYPLLCPEFVIELLSPTDSLKVAQEKMREYLENGAKLGWLIDPEARRLYRYTVEGIELLDAPDTVSAAPVLGFALDSRELWPG
jgi:Uma2 family endonuclease